MGIETRTRRALEYKLARLQVRWRLFRRRVSENSDQFNIRQQPFQHEARQLRLWLMRTRSHPNDFPYNVHRVVRPRFTGRWSFCETFVQCSRCRAVMWQAERIHGSSITQPRFNLCCRDGQISVPGLPSPPEPLSSLLNDTIFLRNIRLYNSMLSFTSMGGNIDHSVLDGHGPYSFQINGPNYHKIGSLLPPTGEKPRFIQLYFYDTQFEARNRCLALGNPNNINVDVAEQLQNMLDTTNPYVRVFRNARDFLHSNGPDLRIRIISERNGRQYTRPSSDEVAALIVGGENPGEGHRDIILCARDGHLQSVYESNPCYMPLQCPLLFPYGTDGWSPNLPFVDGSRICRENVSMREFYAFYIQFRPDDANILLCGSRLYLQFLVDYFAAIEAYRLNFVRRNQGLLRAELYCGIQDAITAGESDANAIGKRYILPSSFTGGPRYMRQHYLDAMAICSTKGYPDYIITFTCNPNWPEIQKVLSNQPGHTSSDRPDIVVRVFRIRLKELIRDIKDRKLLGKVISDIGVIEFQKRGLPHAHILITLDHNGKPRCSEDIDSLISAELPDEISDPLAFETVTKHMIHGPCGTDVDYAPCMDGSRCTKRYPKVFCEETIVEDNGFVRYRRRDDGRTIVVRGKTIDNRWIVPYNRDICVKYDAHINVERCAQKKVIKYLHKYMHKGPDRATFVIEDNSGDSGGTNIQQIRNVDEIRQYLDCRYVSATEAAWRIVENVDARMTMLIAWFKIKSESNYAKRYTFVEFPGHYVWNRVDRRWVELQQRPSIGRLPYAHLDSGERYYLRMLLTIVRGATCYEDLRTFNGTVYPTFRDVCMARGLLDDNNEWHDALKEAAEWASGPQLRNLFCSFLMFSEVSEPEKLWDQHWEDLTDDLERMAQIRHRDPDYHMSTDERMNSGLCELELILNKNGRSLKDYPAMPLPSMELRQWTCNSLIREYLDYDISKEMETFENFFRTLNVDQLEVFRAIITAYEREEGGVFFVYGSGGTGKTHLWKTIISCFRSKGLLTLSVASSGIAAFLLPLGKTAHSLFKIPIELEDTSVCYVTKNSDTTQLLRQASLIIWDEAPMARHYAFEALDRTMRDISYDNRLFGGKLIILGGDFRQVLLVVSKGSRQDVVAASLCRASFWNKCKIMHLKINMRLMDSNLRGNSHENMSQFGNWIFDAGNGAIQGLYLLRSGEPYWIEIPDTSLIKNDNHDLDNLINFVYPDLCNRFWHPPIAMSMN